MTQVFKKSTSDFWINQEFDPRQLPIFPNYLLIYAVHHHNPQLLSSLVVVMYYNNSPQLSTKDGGQNFITCPKNLKIMVRDGFLNMGLSRPFLYFSFFWDITRLHFKIFTIANDDRKQERRRRACSVRSHIIRKSPTPSEYSLTGILN